MGAAGGEIMVITIKAGGSPSGTVQFPASGESFSVTGSYDAGTGTFSLADSGGLTINGSATPQALKGAVKKPGAAAPAGFGAKKK